MLIIVIHNNNNSFLFFWLRIIIVITWFIENLMIYWYFWYYLRSPETFTLTCIFSVSTLFTFILHLQLHIYISFHYIEQSHLVLQNHSCVWCLVTFSGTFFLTSQKGDDIVAVDYLKVKNDVTHWKTIIFDSWQVHAAPSFLLVSS